MKTGALEIEELTVPGYERVIYAVNSRAGLECFVAIHDTTLGPALGGTRIFPYSNKEAALQDALLLAKAMTYKSAIAEDGLGGGKAVIIADNEKEKTPELLMAYGELIGMLGGLFIAAEDYGTTVEDLQRVGKVTPYVAAIQTPTSSGDPSRFTARGVYLGIKAVAHFFWDALTLGGKTVAIQGLGNVGSKLLEQLFWSNADLIITDRNMEKARKLGHMWGARVVDPDEIFSVECDIFAPCALGGAINDKTLPLLKCKAVAGAANNQLADDSFSQKLLDRGILYAPDFVINAGGILNAAGEFEPGGYQPKQVLHKVDRIYDTLLAIFETARLEKKTTNEVAMELAEYKLKNLIGKRTAPIRFD
ncbi:MAG: leucine dehydrogenase [Chlamydiia bacterium]|nr:leucine dehydrogenase [Chlamydiia bacterium]